MKEKNDRGAPVLLPFLQQREDLCCIFYDKNYLISMPETFTPAL